MRTPTGARKIRMASVSAATLLGGWLSAADLTMSPGITYTIPSSGDADTLPGAAVVIDNLSIGAGGTLNLTNNLIIIKGTIDGQSTDSARLTELRSLLISG